VGKPWCSVLASTATFGGTDPCPMSPKRLAIQAVCSKPEALALSVTLPTGIFRGDILIPIGNRSVDALTLKESGQPVWVVSAVLGPVTRLPIYTWCCCTYLHHTWYPAL